MKANYLLAALAMLPLLATGKVWTQRTTVEGLADPVGIDVERPRFGWQIGSDGRGVVQRSYRLIVSSSREKALSLEGDVYDSGVVRSAQSQWVEAQGFEPQPNKEYHWRVLVATNKGKAAWSDVARWTTGLMRPGEFRGGWIGLDSLFGGERQTRHSRIAARYLRKEFGAAKGVRRATVHVSGLGYYTLYVNGVRVGDDVLTPNGTDYTKSVVYNTYDVTSLIQSRNAIGAVLEGGHYFAQTQNYQANVRTTYGFPKLWANLVVEYADGTQDVVATDTTWRITADGPTRYANEYDGELYDARKQLGAWAEAGYDDARWMQARSVDAPGGRLRGNVSPAMSVYAVEKPAAIKKFGGKYIVDFGTNNAGRIRLHVKAAEGDTVRIRHAELLAEGDPSRLYTANLRGAEATARYVSDGREATWAPEFTYYGFRYAEVEGVEKLAEGDIVRELIADRMDDDGTDFAIEATEGADILNKLVANARRGVRSNYKGMPVDCPQRDERMPWLGDRTTGALGESYLMDCRALYAKWANDICEGQDGKGRISDVAPAYWRLYNTNVTWPAALPFVCDMLHRQYGDLRPMQESYAHIKRFLQMVRRDNYKDGLVPYDRYGDWCVPPEEPKLVHSKDPQRKTDGRLISSAYYHYLNRMMQRYADLMGKADDKAYFEREAEATLKAVNDTFLLPDGRGYSNLTATANLLPLAMGIAPDSLRSRLLDTLHETIAVKNGGHVSSGVIGIQWLMRTLADGGMGDLAYRLATTTSYPGWGYMVSRGATTIWELWNGDTANPSMNSGNHVMLLGDLLPWCYERLAGIQPAAPGFSRILLAPDFTVKALTRVSASHPTPYGPVRSEWRREGDKIKWRVAIPPNTTATLRLPNGKTVERGSGEYQLTTPSI